jgi:hypothetical protein
MYRALVVVLVAGCGIDRNIEDTVTIHQGVYGLLVSGCDTSGCIDQPASNEHVIIYAPGQSNRSYADTKSDGEGVFQIELPAGDYTLCTYSCTPVTVAPLDRVRFDWTSGPGGGHWQRI